MSMTQAQCNLHGYNNIHIAIPKVFTCHLKWLSFTLYKWVPLFKNHPYVKCLRRSLFFFMSDVFASKQTYLAGIFCSTYLTKTPQKYNILSITLRFPVLNITILAHFQSFYSILTLSCHFYVSRCIQRCIVSLYN